MKHIPRIINIKEILKRKSLFLFGPRQVGKTELIKHQLKDIKTYNLLNYKTFALLASNPEIIRQQLNSNDKYIVIDEVQKLPELLDEIQLLIDNHKINVLLTGSSARKLKRAGTNLLGGRTRKRILHPFIKKELDSKFDLDKALTRGLLPSIYFSDSYFEDLENYIGDYLQVEVSAEAAVRNIMAFSRFLEIAALCHGQMINFTNIANDSQVSVNTIREYFTILKDTFIGFELDSWKKSIKRKPISTPKFYFFDIGVVWGLRKMKTITSNMTEYGIAFESYIFHELKSYCDYKNINSLNYWRSISQFEVDFILDDRIAIEVKSKKQINEKDLKGLKALMEEEKLEKYYLVSLEERSRKVNGIEIINYKKFIDELWKDNL